MFIFWGSKGYHKVLGETTSAIECGNCHNAANWEIIEAGRRFTLYFIPLFPYGKKYYVACPICSAGREIDKQDIEKFSNA